MHLLFTFTFFSYFSFFFFFNDPATTEIYTLSLHDALPICWWCSLSGRFERGTGPSSGLRQRRWSSGDRKSTRLNSSLMSISYAVFCLKKKKNKKKYKLNNINNRPIYIVNVPLHVILNTHHS